MNRISLSSARKRKRERESKIEIKQDPTATHEAQKIQLFEEASIVRYRNKIFFPSSFPRFQFKEDKFNSRPRHEISSSEDVLFELRARFYIQIFADKGLAPRYTHTHTHTYIPRDVNLIWPRENCEAAETQPRIRVVRSFRLIGRTSGTTSSLQTTIGGNTPMNGASNLIEPSRV